MSTDIDALKEDDQGVCACGAELRKARNLITSLQAELSKHQESEFHPDWSMLKATRNSLREHQRIGKHWEDEYHKGVDRFAVLTAKIAELQEAQ